MYTLIYYKESDYETYCGSDYYGSEFMFSDNLEEGEVIERLILQFLNDLYRCHGEGNTDQCIILKDGVLIESLYRGTENKIIKLAENCASMLKEYDELETKRIEKTRIDDAYHKKQKEDYDEFIRLSKKFSK